MTDIVIDNFLRLAKVFNVNSTCHKMQKQVSVVLVTSLLLLTQALKAQDSIPLLTGTVNISIKEGTFDCDLTLSNIPRIQDYFIRINSGMNILRLFTCAGGHLTVP